MSKKVTFGTKPERQAPTAEEWVENRANDDPNKRLTIDIPASLHKRIKATCANEGVKMSDTIRELLEKHFSH